MDDEQRAALMSKITDNLAAALGIPYSHPDAVSTINKPMVEAAVRALMVRVIDPLLAKRPRQREMSVEYECGCQEFWDLEPEGHLRLGKDECPTHGVAERDVDVADGLRCGRRRDVGKRYTNGQ